MHTSGVPLGSHLGLFPWNYPRSRSCTIPSPTRLPVIPPSQHPPHPGPREHPPGSRHRRLLLPISELQMGILQHVVISTDFDQHKLSEIYPYCCRDPGFVFFFFLIAMFSIFAGIYQSVHSPVSRHMTCFQSWVCGHCSQCTSLGDTGILSPTGDSGPQSHTCSSLEGKAPQFPQVVCFLSFSRQQGLRAVLLHILASISYRSFFFFWSHYTA